MKSDTAVRSIVRYSETWQRKHPLRIAAYTFHVVEVVVVEIEQCGVRGRGECCPIYYRSETARTVVGAIDRIVPLIEAGATRSEIQSALPPGSARNAVDCALWDLEAKLSGMRAWELAELREFLPLLTTMTCSADAPEEVVRRALNNEGARAIKLKLTGESADFDRVAKVRAALPEVWLGVDANQGFSRRFFDDIHPSLVEARVSLIEQPFPVGREEWLSDVDRSIPIAADESIQDLVDYNRLRGFFDVVNIKLDKCGGLTEALAIAASAAADGLGIMVGNMGGTSLAMAPAMIVGQRCDIVDLDGPVFLREDRDGGARYLDGLVSLAEDFWG